ncbi:MAG: hypothetical protein II669_00695 [Elusimicrobia bacterium]|nr:hypothetical protein [Elusimicrobiota bacterium]
MAKTTVTIKYPDFKKWVKCVNELTVKTGTAIQETAVNNAPRKTGVYQRSIDYDGDKTVTANANYSADIEYGTNAHEIKPVNAKALHFKQNGKEVFYKKVNHPGTKPNPVMRMAARTVQKQIPQIFKDLQNKYGLS